MGGKKKKCGSPVLEEPKPLGSNGGASRKGQTAGGLKAKNVKAGKKQEGQIGKGKISKQCGIQGGEKGSKKETSADDTGSKKITRRSG